MSHALHSCADLVQLDVSRSMLISDAAFAEIFREIPHVQELNLESTSIQNISPVRPFHRLIIELTRCHI